jgi:hypothetical protein
MADGLANRVHNLLSSMEGKSIAALVDEHNIEGEISLNHDTCVETVLLRIINNQEGDQFPFEHKIKVVTFSKESIDYQTKKAKFHKIPEVTIGSYQDSAKKGIASFKDFHPYAGGLLFVFVSDENSFGEYASYKIHLVKNYCMHSYADWGHHRKELEEKGEMSWSDSRLCEVFFAKLVNHFGYHGAMIIRISRSQHYYAGTYKTLPSLDKHDDPINRFLAFELMEAKESYPKSKE